MANYNNFTELAAAIAGANNNAAVITVKNNIQADMIAAGISIANQDLANEWLNQISNSLSYNTNFYYLNNGASIFAQLMAFTPDPAMPAGEYKSYVALITQAAAADPTVKVLKNEIGTIVPSRAGAGGYKLSNSTGLFTANKTWVVLNTVDFHAAKFARIFWQNANEVTIVTETLASDILTGVISGTQGDIDILADTPLEIRVYQ